MSNLSQGQSRKFKVTLISIAIFLVTTYLVASYFNKLFGNSDPNTEVSMFDILKTILPYTISFSFGIFTILSLIYVRESNKVLPKGFYTKNSWLDIKHNSLVAVERNSLVIIEIEDKQTFSVQEAFQDKASLEELIKLSNPVKKITIPLNEVTRLISEHNAHHFSIEHGEKTHTVDFMTPLVKAHALQSI